MIEGWAVYTERMMLESGYGENADEMWLMYYKWNLRSTCNTILDYSVHTKEMSKDQMTVESQLLETWKALNDKQLYFCQQKK